MVAVITGALTAGTECKAVEVLELDADRIDVSGHREKMGGRDAMGSFVSGSGADGSAGGGKVGSFCTHGSGSGPSSSSDE